MITPVGVRSARNGMRLSKRFRIATTRKSRSASANTSYPTFESPLPDLRGTKGVRFVFHGRCESRSLAALLSQSEERQETLMWKSLFLFSPNCVGWATLTLTPMANHLRFDSARCLIRSPLLHQCLRLMPPHRRKNFPLSFGYIAS